MLTSFWNFLVRLDTFFFNIFNQSIKCRFLDILMQLFTHLAGFSSVVGICLFLTLFLPSIPGPNVLGAVFFAQLAAQSIKFIIRRIRPHIKLPNVNIFTKLMQYDPSFPSAHTATITALGGVIAIMEPSTEDMMAAICTCVGISRIYLGQHYPSDVLVGAVIGIVSAKLSCMIF